MTQIIKNKTVVTDDWQVLRPQAGDDLHAISVPAGKHIVPLKLWLAQREPLLRRQQETRDLAVWYASDDNAADLQQDLALFELVAIDFPKFADGRGYSIAYYLRNRYQYQGELRAIGDVLRDQLFYMKRVGFDAFAVRADKNIHDAVKSLSDFSEKYQAAWDEKNPLFRRAERSTKTGV